MCQCVDVCVVILLIIFDNVHLMIDFHFEMFYWNEMIIVCVCVVCSILFLFCDIRHLCVVIIYYYYWCCVCVVMFDLRCVYVLCVWFALLCFILLHYCYCIVCVDDDHLVCGWYYSLMMLLCVCGIWCIVVSVDIVSYLLIDDVIIIYCYSIYLILLAIIIDIIIRYLHCLLMVISTFVLLLLFVDDILILFIITVICW